MLIFQNPLVQFMTKDLVELVNAEVISQETADKINAYYLSKKEHTSNKLFIIFGVLGALLVGLGLILIVAHNWDELAQGIKTIFAFIPLLIGQILCTYTLLKQQESVTWRESSSVFLVFGIGASISLIAQIYNMSGNLPAFILTWSLLSLPLVYIMRSSMTSLLYIIAITYYGVEKGYWASTGEKSQLYWLLLLLLSPYYYTLIKSKPENNFTGFHHWLIALSIAINIGSTIYIARGAEELLIIMYMSFYAVYYMIGNILLKYSPSLKTNAYILLGSFGTACLLLFLTFEEFWEELADEDLTLELANSSAFYMTVLVSLLAISLLFLQKRPQNLKELKPIEFIFLVFILVFIIGTSSQYFPILLCNILVLTLGVLTVLHGVKKEHLGILNYGLLTITALVVCRFFDKDLTFIVRGILFIVVGAGFFFANYSMLKKRK